MREGTKISKAANEGSFNRYLGDGLAVETVTAVTSAAAK